MSAPFSRDPRVIYLAPKCCYTDGEGRQWCEDNAWPCSDCPDPKNASATKYFLGTDRAECDAAPVTFHCVACGGETEHRSDCPMGP